MHSIAVYVIKLLISNSNNSNNSSIKDKKLIIIEKMSSVNIYILNILGI